MPHLAQQPKVSISGSRRAGELFLLALSWYKCPASSAVLCWHSTSIKCSAYQTHAHLLPSAGPALAHGCVLAS